jgi:glutaredoxin-dependent peroxiredoxin
MSIQVGQNAPDFSLFDSEKNEVKLSNLKGKKVVLLFVPAAFTGTCTKEFCSIRDGLNQYQNLNAMVLGISCDSPFVLAKWKEQEHLNFSLLSDYNKTTTAAYGVAYKHGEFVLGMEGHCRRSAFVIDENGVVKYAEVLDKASDLPDFDAIQQALK